MPELPSNSEGNSNLNDVDNIIDVLAGDDDESVDDDKTDKCEKKPKGDKEIIQLDTDEDEDEDKESKDSDEVEDEDADEEKDKLDLKADVTVPPKKKEIEKEFPGFFKKFPWFEKMMFRDREINEMFGSFDGAKEAHTKAEALDELEGYFVNGSSQELLSKMKENDAKAFTKFTSGFLKTLQKVDKDTYQDITLDLIKRVLIHTYTDGKTTENEDLQNAAKILSKYIFPRGMEAPKDEEEVNPRSEELERREAEFNDRQLKTHVNDVQTRIGNVLKNTIEDHIDPRSEMTDYVKKVAIKQVLDNVDEQLANNKAFRTEVTKLWNDAQKAE